MLVACGRGGRAVTFCRSLRSGCRAQFLDEVESGCSVCAAVPRAPLSPLCLICDRSASVCAALVAPLLFCARFACARSLRISVVVAPKCIARASRSLPYVRSVVGALVAPRPPCALFGQVWVVCSAPLTPRRALTGARWLLLAAARAGRYPRAALLCYCRRKSAHIRSVALSLRSGCRPFFADEFFTCSVCPWRSPVLRSVSARAFSVCACFRLCYPP